MMYKHSGAVVLVLFALSGALWLLAEGLSQNFVLFIVLLLCLVSPVRHCDHLLEKREQVSFHFIFISFIYFHSLLVYVSS